MMNNKMELNDDALELAAGGLNHNPDDAKLQELGLWGYVRNMDRGWTDVFYDTWRKETGTWKHVGSEDMLKYVERTLGPDSARYQALYKYCNAGPQGIREVFK